MVQVTEKAASEFKTLLEKEGKPNHGVKLFIAGFSCSGPQYGLAIEEKPEDGEKVFESNDVKLYLTKETADALEGVEIDYVKTEHGEGFVINNPNANCGPSCGGCG